MNALVIIQVKVVDENDYIQDFDMQNAIHFQSTMFHVVLTYLQHAFHDRIT